MCEVREVHSLHRTRSCRGHAQRVFATAANACLIEWQAWLPFKDEITQRLSTVEVLLEGQKLGSLQEKRPACGGHSEVQ